jgi:hypothetical protein
MKRIILTAMMMFGASSVFAATMTGTISDSKCGATHKAMKEHDAKLTDTACTEACVKGGAKYVFASGGKVYQIENQNDPQLAANAGRTVKLTGDIKGDTITVSQVAATGKTKTRSKKG